MGLVAVLVAGLAAGCAGPQSALDPGGVSADRIATLWWWMAGAGGLVWIAVIALAVYAIRVRPGRAHPERYAGRFIVGGTGFTVLVLTILLLAALRLLPGLVAEPPEDAVRIHVTGEEFWWRATYVRGGDSVEVANELWLPAGRPAVLSLQTVDVIHSFWLPSLGGKVDMLPGRTTRLVLEPTRIGEYRGTCAEFCGLSHAYMSFAAVVADSAGFAAWLDRQAADAAAPATPLAERGRAAFREHGCAACHTIRGTEADGRVGPDLTHVGGRRRLAAGRLPNDAASFATWIRDAPALKPGVHMPAFRMIPEADLRALAVYLDGLE